MVGPYDVITARAFASLPELVRLSAGALSADGVWMAMKGKRPEAEIAGLPPGARVFHVEHVTVPGLPADRCIVWMRPSAP
jgi:16S rRNA (guanine527-N7)-methyltransferase